MFFTRKCVDRPEICSWYVLPVSNHPVIAIGLWSSVNTCLDHPPVFWYALSHPPPAPCLLFRLYSGRFESPTSALIQTSLYSLRWRDCVSMLTTYSDERGTWKLKEMVL